MRNNILRYGPEAVEAQKLRIQIIDLLTKASDLIDTEEKWTKKFLATDKEGMCVNPDSENACTFCSVGAVRRVGYLYGYSNKLQNLVFDALVSVIDMSKYTSLAAFNDDVKTDYATVINIFNDAKTKLEAEFDEVQKEILFV